MFEQAAQLIEPGGLADADANRLLAAVGFAEQSEARRRLQGLADNDASRRALAECLPMLLTALSEAATPDGSLVNFDRFAQSVPNRADLYRYLADNPRAVEILVKLFVGSQFLTEILLRNPSYLQKLTQHKRIAEFKSRADFVGEARQQADEFAAINDKIDALRRFQRWELLRIGACDSFGLMDLKSVTIQLSLLADSIVQSCLSLFSDELHVDLDGFAVLAFGKLGGEELNYSSDIDLVFVSRGDATKFWPLGQRLIKALIDATSEGFLYRVDMRLRPWGRSGALVTSVDAYVDYLRKHGMLWEKQALLKARVIAGNVAVGEEFLKQAEPLVYHLPVDLVRANVHEMKERIEAGLAKQGRKWGEVKSGEGSIRDVEFVTQFLQLAYGGDNPHVRSINTLDALVRLADFGCIAAPEFRHLTNGYVFLRTIEHSLQLMHYKQVHALPESRRELAYLARRLDFPNAEQLLAHYQRHCEAIRAIYEKYIEQEEAAAPSAAVPAIPAFPDHTARLEPAYKKIFPEQEIARHAELLGRLSDATLVEVDAKPKEHNLWQVTVVGFDQPGDLSMICGLLFVYGFDIAEGQVFTDEQVVGRRPLRGRRRKKGESEEKSSAQHARRFVNVFTVRPPGPAVSQDDWLRYKQELSELMQLGMEGKLREAQGRLAKRVASAMRQVPAGQARRQAAGASLFPVEIDVDNNASPKFTLLRIWAEDTIGFLYEFTNALSLAGIDIIRVIVSSLGNRVTDTLYVTDAAGNKLIDENKQKELRAAVVLIKHFTHLLPRSPNPESALLHFRDFLEQLFRQRDWIDELSSLEQTSVLEALARLLGVSDFLWEDFLRLQHENLFPVVKDVEALAIAKPIEQLHAELAAEISRAADLDERRRVLNAFKDREMFRADMRHILGHITEFGRFAAELTDVAEVVVEGAWRICAGELQARYGEPRLDDGRPCRLTICALGKFGGRELGFASDIELMFVYEGSGRCTGPESRVQGPEPRAKSQEPVSQTPALDSGFSTLDSQITNAEFFTKLVELFTKSIQARRQGIFEVDLRLRPYGRAGSLAVASDAFRQYFAPDGAAWPYERQALVKLRPVAGDPEFGRRIVELRDELIYTGEPFDVAAMRAMREKQLRQLVKAGTVNAKLGPGGLVDTEYLVQGLQITHGRRDPSLRTTNTREAMAALERAGFLSASDHRQLLEAYVFQRQLIDALRMVRGHARDLTVPHPDSEEFEYLAHRLGYGDDRGRLQDDLERYSTRVHELSRLLEGL